MSGESRAPKSLREGVEGGRNPVIVMDRSSGFDDHLGIGMCEQLSEQGRALPGERQGGEDGLRALVGLGDLQEPRRLLRTGETGDQAVAQPRQA